MTLSLRLLSRLRGESSEDGHILLLKYIYKHQGKPIDLDAVLAILPLEVDYAQVERDLAEGHLIIPDSKVWRLTPKGEIFAETLFTFGKNKFYMVGCSTLCMGLLFFLILRAIL